LRYFFKQYIPYYKEYKIKFFLAFIGMLLVAGGTSGTAYAVKPLLDQIFINKDKQMLSILPFFIILLYFAKGFGTYIQAYNISYIGQDILRLIRDKMFQHILTLDLDFFHKKHSGELISRITNDINRIQSAISNQIAEFIREILTIVTLIFVVIYQSPVLAFYSLVVLPLAIYPLSILAKKMKKISFRSQESISDITSGLTETFNNIEIIKANSREKFESVKFEKQNNTLLEINLKSVKINELTNPIMETLGAFAFAIVIATGGSEVIKNNLTIGEFFSFLTALFMLYAPIRKISTIYNSMQDALAANERINEILNMHPHIISGVKSFPKKLTEITFKDIELSYGDNIALKDINFEVSIGEKIALVGDSGGGKSSLANLVIRFYDPNKGKILYNGINCKDINMKDLRENISIVTQRVYIFNDTIAANVAYGLKIDENRVLEALHQAHAYDFVVNLQDGIYTKLNQSGSNLSGGQRQRIAIARALYKSPKILILDEATSALDNKSESIVTEIIDEISKDKITFVIAHRLSTIKNVDKIAVFKDGKIVGLDSEVNLLNNCEEYIRLKNLS